VVKNFELPNECNDVNDGNEGNDLNEHNDINEQNEEGKEEEKEACKDLAQELEQMQPEEELKEQDSLNNLRRDDFLQEQKFYISDAE